MPRPLPLFVALVALAACFDGPPAGRERIGSARSVEADAGAAIPQTADSGGGIPQPADAGAPLTDQEPSSSDQRPPSSDQRGSSPDASTHREADSRSQPPPEPDARVGDVFAAERQFCVDKVNAARKGAGLGPLKRNADPATEACADKQARVEFEQYNPAGHVPGNDRLCGNMMRGRADGRGYSMRSLIDEVIGDWVRWGPGEVHYEQMTATYVTSVTCGFFVTGSSAFFGIDYF